MGRKAKILLEEKLNAVEDYLGGKKSSFQICSELKINKKSLQNWLNKYKTSGETGLETLNRNAYYPESLKLKAVSDYLKGKKSQQDICNMYNISSQSILFNWIKKYNGHEKSKSHSFQEDKNMTRGRNTTYDERIEIVAFCIENNDDYQLTSKRFDVSYQQVYTWIRKYKDHGYEALIDKRGKRNKTYEMSDSEKNSAQLKLLEFENRRLKMENDFLKKLEEVKRRG
ncbi:MAG: helix-turn-helix domain-containing protein [Proteocatella sp.]